MSDLFGTQIVGFPSRRLILTQAEGETEVLVAGDPERKHMALCDKLGGIPYQKKQIEHAVSIGNLLRKCNCFTY